MRRAFAVLAVLASVWSALAWVLDGIALSIGPLRISSSHSIRPLIVAAAAAIIYIALCGPKAAGADLRRLLRALTPRRLALLLTTAVIAVGIANNSWAVGGSDSYSYASQMDLWLDGDMKVPVTMATEVPWPDALATFTPFGYTAVAREMAIAPITPPGRPLLMAAFKSIGSHAAAFLVVPLTGGLLAWSTFLLGRRPRFRPPGARRSVARSNESHIPHDVQVADERRSRRRILDAGNLLDVRNDRSKRGGSGRGGIAWESDSAKSAPTCRGARRMDCICHAMARLVAFAFAALPGGIVIAVINNACSVRR